MIKKVLAVLGIVTAAGAPAIYAATRPAATETATTTGAIAPTTSAQQAGTIVCPLTGEEIEPCCCPLNGDK